jgi:hypothetical protein
MFFFRWDFETAVVVCRGARVWLPNGKCWQRQLEGTTTPSHPLPPTPKPALLNIFQLLKIGNM